jgi:hypothetical protein
MTKSDLPQIPQYKVRVWEIVAVFASSMLLVSAAIFGLTLKFIANAFNPQRAEAIANNIMDYQIPGSSQGLLGLNIAGAKIALITSKSEDPDVQLLVARVPVNAQTDKSQIEQILDNTFLGGTEEAFQVTSARVENKNFCNFSVPVRLKEGQLTLPERPFPVFAVNYRTSVTLSRNRYFVIMLTRGEDARQKAATVFSSLKCK